MKYISAISIVFGTVSGCIGGSQLRASSQDDGSSSISQQTPQTEDTSTRLQQFFDLWREGRYLAAMKVAEGADPSNIPEPLNSFYLQFRPALDGKVVLREDEQAWQSTPDPEAFSIYDGAVARDAIADITRKARLARVVIINESHDNPRDRAFILEVAEALRPLGYSVFAAETFTNAGDGEQIAARMNRLRTDGYPRFSTGTFSNEPMFGYLVRRVIQLGYRPVSYEHLPTESDGGDPAAARELGQAQNLARVIALNPQAKFLIHVGYSHAAERPSSGSTDGETWMAEHLAKLTGLNPLTIDQTGLTQFRQSEASQGLYAAIVPLVGTSAKIFYRDGNPIAWGELGRAVDLQVIHPPITIVNGRPNWLAKTGRSAVRIPRELLPKQRQRLIQVFAQHDAVDAVPIDQVLVSVGEVPAPVLYVPRNTEIRWAVQDD